MSQSFCTRGQLFRHDREKQDLKIALPRIMTICGSVRRETSDPANSDMQCRTKLADATLSRSAFDSRHRLVQSIGRGFANWIWRRN
jgi:hypothetical protein